MMIGNKIQLWKNAISCATGVTASWKPICPGVWIAVSKRRVGQQRRKPKTLQQKARAEGCDAAGG